MKKFRNYDVGSIEYVILHALWRKKRGKKRFSVQFLDRKNPEEALFRAIQLNSWCKNLERRVKKYWESNPVKSHREGHISL